MIHHSQEFVRSSRQGIHRWRFAGILLLGVLLNFGLTPPVAMAKKSRQQDRPAKVMVNLPLERIRVSDGDTMVITWTERDKERVRVLGIDTPEVAHDNHFLTEDQSYGPQARSFAQERFAQAKRVQLLRAEETDGYGRTLGYFFLDGENYSVEVLKARLAYETVTHFGDNGFPEEAKACLEAAQVALEKGPLPFQKPYLFRRAMREKSKEGASAKGDS